MVDSLLNSGYGIGLLVHYMEHANWSFGKSYHFGTVKKVEKFHTSRTLLLLCFKANLIPSMKILNKIKQQLRSMVLAKTYIKLIYEIKAIPNIVNC